MTKKFLVTYVLLFLMLAGVTQTVWASAETIPNQDHIILESIGDPETVDPAWAYDTASAGLIFQVYDTLIAFDTESTSEFVPQLATEWSVSGDGLHAYFKIRGTYEGHPTWGDVKFSNGANLTTEDVEYSFERSMVQDRSGGPIWMFNEPLLGSGWPDKSGWPDDVTNPINLAVARNDTHVWFNLAMVYPPFLQIVSQSWGSIVDKAFCIAHGDWPGTWNNWRDYADPATAPLDVAGNVMCGTGPYILDYWTHGVEWSVVRFDGYWEGWPAPHCSSSAQRITERVVYEWGTRLADFRAGLADTVYVPRAYIGQVEDWPGIRGMKDIPTLITTGMFFNFDIDSASAYCGSQQLDGEGIPLDFFSDIDVRKAFAYAFEYERFIDEVFLGEAEQCPSPHIRGLPFDTYVWDGDTLPNSTYLAPIDMYYYDPYEIAAHMQAAVFDDPLGPGTVTVWERGFKMTITYNAGNVPRLVSATMLKENIERVFLLGPDLIANTGDEAPGTVDIITTPVTWSTYLGELWFYPSFQSVMPTYIIGWLADYPDPHNFVVPFQHSEGDFAAPSSYNNPTVDALIETAISETDTSARPAMYHQIAQTYYDDCPSVCLYQATGRRWERDWVQGWYYNPIFPMNYYRHFWKGLNGDINGDNKVDMDDSALINNYWYARIENPDPPPEYIYIYGPAGKYDRISDVSPYLQYATYGIGSPGEPWESIGFVDIYDGAIVSAHWDEYVP